MSLSSPTHNIKGSAGEVEVPGGSLRTDAVAGGGGPQVDQEFGGGLDVLRASRGAATLAAGGEGGDAGAGLGQRVGHGWAPTA
jgi:hypothetical protein